jgi:diguanylate cyclase (GGDEF)-like protein
MTATDRQDNDEARFREEVRASTHATAVVAGAVAAVGYPAWSFFDHLIDPANAWQFTQIRLAATVPIVVLWALLFTSFGRHRPELLILGILASVEIGIAAMIAMLDAHHAPYALGMSVAIYGSAFLLIWSPLYTVALAGISWAALAFAWLTIGPGASAGQIATVSFYVVTASVIAVAGQYFRERTARKEFEARTGLEAEQERSRQLVRELDRLSYEDALTGLANRRAWDEAVKRECARLQRQPAALSVLLCDVDFLKEVNDRFGHPIGDAVLRAVADSLASRAREADLVARLGGDEFAILAPATDEAGAASLARDLCRLVEATVTERAGLPPVTLSIGTASWSGPGETPEGLLSRADQNLYAAKGRRDLLSQQSLRTQG